MTGSPILPGDPVQDALPFDQAVAAIPAAPDRTRTLVPRSRPISRDVDAICALLVGKAEHADDRRLIVTAIVAAARITAGIVDQNVIRDEYLTGRDGRLQVKPQLVGAVYRHLRHLGLLEHHGYTTSTDHAGGNAGKPIRTYRLTRTIPGPRQEAESAGYVRHGIKHDLEDGIGARRAIFGIPAVIALAEARAANEVRYRTGHGRWSGLLTELLATAIATDDRTDLRRGVVQIAAAAVAWVDAIDRLDDGSSDSDAPARPARPVPAPRSE